MCSMPVVPEADVDTPGWLAGLNDAQVAAVEHNGGPLLVIAGAGTGKTRTIASRVARLTAEGVSPERILLLTFTRRAAREMLARAQALARSQAAGRVWGGTFHAVANRLLHRYGAAVGLRQGFTVLDGADVADLLGVVRAELGYNQCARRFPSKDTLAAIYSRTANTQTKLVDAVSDAFPWCRGDVAAIRDIFVAYAERKRRHNVVDYDDLLLYWRALGSSDTYGPKLRSLFDHILVDEYQDTNSIQADIVDSMRGPDTELCVVGDDAQAIYSFRAATVVNIDEFPIRFAGTTIVKLEESYRATPPLLAVANGVIAQSPDRYRKQLWSRRPSGPRPELITCSDESAQSEVVCRNVLDHRERGVALRDQAVLFRTGHHSDALELELACRHIPFHKFGGLRFLEAGHIKDMLALLRILDNPADELAWHRVLGLIDGIGPKTTERVLRVLGLAGDGDDLARAGAFARFLDDDIAVPAAAADQIGRLREALRDASGRSGAGSEDGTREPRPAIQIDRLRSFCGDVVRRKYDKPEARIADLSRLGALAGDYKRRAAFLAELTLDPPAATGDLAGPPHLDDDYLVLSTIHSAKGGEWRVVHVIHAADGNIPSDMATADADGIDEERRLLYVALTRARDMLYVTFPLRYYHRSRVRHDGHNFAQLSRFLTPVEDCFEMSSAGAAPVEDVPVLALEGADPVATFLTDLWNA